MLKKAGCTEIILVWAKISIYDEVGFKIFLACMNICSLLELVGFKSILSIKIQRCFSLSESYLMILLLMFSMGCLPS